MADDSSVINQIAAKLGEDPARVCPIVEEFCVALSRGLYEYKGLNGDYLGEQLHWEIGHRAFFHLLGFLDHFSEKYEWEPGSAREYILRLMSEEEWTPLSQEAADWKSGNRLAAQSESSPEVIAEFSSKAGVCAGAMLSNAAYIQNELPSIELPDENRSAILTLCSDLIGTKHDVVHEIAEIADLSESSDDSKVADRIRRVMAWLSEDVTKLHEQVKLLEALARSDQRYRLAYLLVAESGTNILNCFAAAGACADRALCNLERL